MINILEQNIYLRIKLYITSDSPDYIKARYILSLYRIYIYHIIFKYYNK